MCLAVLALACGGRQTMQVTSKPVADFKFTQSALRPQVFTFDAANSSTTVGSIAEYRWLFGDEAAGAAPMKVTGPTAQHAYTAAGTYTVTLVVADDKGAPSDAVTKEVTVPTVNTAGPTANITGPSTGMPSMQLTFDGSGSTPAADIQTYAWDFGDAVTVSGPDKLIVQHTFTAARTYRVTLTVTDSLGQSNTDELQVAIGDVSPIAICSWTPMPAVQGVPVAFNGSMSQAPMGSTLMLYVWDFGDGSSMGLGAMTSHTYNVQATFQPKLKVFDTQNRSHEVLCAPVTVGPPPLCAGDYTLMANPMSQSLCGIGTSNWAGSSIHLTQNADGGIVGTEQFGMQMLTFTGSWSGNTWTATGTWTSTSMLGTDTHTGTWNGTWVNGCGGWTGTFRDVVTGPIWNALNMPQGCTLNWNVTSNRL